MASLSLIKANTIHPFPLKEDPVTNTQTSNDNEAIQSLQNQIQTLRMCVLILILACVAAVLVMRFEYGGQPDSSKPVPASVESLGERVADIDQCLARMADPTAEQIPFPEPTPGGTETTNLLISLGYCNPPLGD